MVIVLAALTVHMCFLWVAGPLAQLPVAVVLGVFQMQRLLCSDCIYVPTDKSEEATVSCFKV